MEDEDWGPIQFSIEEGRLRADADQLGVLTGGQHDSLEVLVLVSAENATHPGSFFLNLVASGDGELTGLFQPFGWDGDWDVPKPVVINRCE